MERKDGDNRRPSCERATRQAAVGRGEVPRWPALLCFVSLLSACVQGPDYVKPAVEVPAAYRFADQPSQPDSQTVEESWWSGFGDPYLDALVKEALANNRDLRIATGRVDEF